MTIGRAGVFREAVVLLRENALASSLCIIMLIKFLVAAWLAKL
jgi:hypothetical protein